MRRTALQIRSKGSPKTLTPMGGYDNEALGRVEYLPFRGCEYATTQHVIYSSNRIGNRITSDVNGRCGDPFAPEITRPPTRWTQSEGWQDEL